MRHRDLGGAGVAEAAETLAAAQGAAARGAWEQVTELTAALAPTAREERVELAFLRARAALHAELPVAALDALDALAGVEGRPEELMTRDVLRGRALLALGRDADALALLEPLAAAAEGALRAEARLALAGALVQLERLAEAEQLLEDLVASRPPGPTAARVLALYGRLELRRSRGPMAARYLRDALYALGPEEPASTLRLWLYEALLAIALATLDLRLVLWVRAELRTEDDLTLALPPHARRLRELLTLGLLLLGELHAAWAIAADMRELVPAGVPAIAADLLAAQVAGAAGERFTPAQLLARALAEAEQVAWGEAGVAGRRALLSLAEAAATAGLPGTGAVLGMYDQLPPLDARAAASEDAAELAPLEAMARAAIAGTNGSCAEQAGLLWRAIALSRAREDALGELRALLALAGATHDPTALERAATLSRLVPRSWLRGRCDALAEHARGPLRLSRTERRVMEAICEGGTTNQIAHDFGRSPHTIRNQTQRVYQVMNVSTRAALVAKCAAMGLGVRRTDHAAPAGEQLALPPRRSPAPRGPSGEALARSTATLRNPTRASTSPLDGTPGHI